MGPAYEADKIGGWTMMPQMSGQTIESFEGGKFRVTTNEDGIRSTVRVEKGPGVTRIAVMGDSTVFGWGVDDGGTIADGLQRGLDPLRGELGPIEVLNAGQPGYSTTQITAFFEGVVSKYKPDFLIVFLPQHDHNFVAVSDREHLEGGRGLGAARVGLAKHSRIYQLLRAQISPLSEKGYVLPGEQHNDMRVPRVSDDERDENMDRIAAAMGEWGGRLALGWLPSFADLERSTPSRRMGEEWAGIYATEKRIPVIDLRACCGPGGQSLVLPYDKGHLNREGNLKAGAWGASQVADWIRTQRR
ncbi:MAG: SGNH/GDSL hydrolase family protein [Myxococcota bacterium]